MSEQLKFEKDKHYRKRSGDKRLCIWVFGDGSALLVDEMQDIYEYRSPTGRVSLTKKSPNDIVSEWREPRTVQIVVWQCVAKPSRLFADTNICDPRQEMQGWRPFAQVTITEGEGLT